MYICMYIYEDRYMLLQISSVAKDQFKVQGIQFTAYPLEKKGAWREGTPALLLYIFLTLLLLPTSRVASTSSAVMAWRARSRSSRHSRAKCQSSAASHCCSSSSLFPYVCHGLTCTHTRKHTHTHTHTHAHAHAHTHTHACGARAAGGWAGTNILLERVSRMASWLGG